MPLGEPAIEQGTPFVVAGAERRPSDSAVGREGLGAQRENSYLLGGTYQG